MKRLRIVGTWLLIAVLAVFAVWQAAPVQAQETVTAQLRMQIATLNRFLVGMSTVTVPLDQDYTQLFSSGTGANQANALWYDDRTLTASASENLDLNASLTDAFGNSITCTKLKALIVKAATGNTNNVLVGGGSTTITTIFSATNDQAIVRPGGIFIFTAPDATGAALTAGSADVLSVTNSSGSTSVAYDIFVVCAE